MFRHSVFAVPKLPMPAIAHGINRRNLATSIFDLKLVSGAKVWRYPCTGTCWNCFSVTGTGTSTTIPGTLLVDQQSDKLLWNEAIQFCR
jgi:hypothetical protein